MKKIIILSKIILFLPFICFGQLSYPSCGLVGDEPEELIVPAGELLYIPLSECDPIVLKCNFVFFTRDDGGGVFDINNPLHEEIIQFQIDHMNFRFANIENSANCATEISYSRDAGVRTDVQIHFIQNEEAWDYTSHGGTECPGEVQAPELEAAINSFNSNHKSEFNYFFLENGDEVNFLEQLINSGSTLNAPFFSNVQSDFTGCSDLAKEYDNTESQIIIMTDFYTEFLKRKYFHEVYFPDHANVPADEITEWHTKDVYPQVVIHELGHTILNQFHTQGCNNIMKTAFNNRHFLSPKQLNTLHKTLATRNLHKFVDCNSLTEAKCNIVTTGDHTINYPMTVFGNIVVESGHTLTITNKVQLNENSRIFIRPSAKLIIDGGILTSYICGNSWAGIKVAGGNTDFDIEVKNGAIIENTSQAAITMWPTNPTDLGNGIARIENSTFNDVRGAVGFFAKTPSNTNPSYIRDCTIINASWGLSNTNCQNIEVSSNTFNNIELECIFGSMGSYHIHNTNIFNSGQQDILFMNTSPTLSSLIENNTFNGRNTGYHADGSVYAQNRIEFNQFYNGQIDILNDGHNSFKAWYNMSHAGLGGVSFSNGDRPGEYAFNTFDGSFIAQLPVGDNPGFNFFENCYASSFTDVYIDGSVAPIIQQGFGDAANNCFTHQGNNSVINDLGGNPDLFTYVEPNDNTVDCRDAINAHMNVNIEKIGSPVSPPDCYDPFTTPPTVAFSPCNPQEGQEEAAKLWLLNKIREIENNTNLNESQRERFLSIYINCLKKVVGRLTEIKIERGEYADARSLYQPESSDDDKVMVYGLYVIEGDLMSAATYLNGLSSESIQLMDFKTVQQSNLQRIQSGYTYEPSASELVIIRTIAEKDHTYAAYAKALYYAYTGEKLVSELPLFIQSELENRSSKITDISKTVSISPNPFSHQLNIVVNGLDDPKIYIYDLFGKPQTVTYTVGNPTINTSNWSEGLYVVKVFDGNELIKTQKVVLVR